MGTFLNIEIHTIPFNILYCRTMKAFSITLLFYMSGMCQHSQLIYCREDLLSTKPNFFKVTSKHLRRLKNASSESNYLSHSQIVCCYKTIQLVVPRHVRLTCHDLCKSEVTFNTTAIKVIKFISVHRGARGYNMLPFIKIKNQQCPIPSRHVTQDIVKP